jgi:hypothetical protein
MTTAKRPVMRRHDMRTRFDQALAEKARWHDPLFAAQQLRTVLDYPSLPGDPYAFITRKQAAEEFRRWHPGAVQRLGGEAVLAAATPAQSACRWCMAAAHSRVHRVRTPDPANLGARFLLGPPCRHAQRMDAAERQAVMAALRDRVEPSRLDARRRQLTEVVGRQRQLVASGAARGFIVGDPASWRRWARQDLANRAPWVLDLRNRAGGDRMAPVCTPGSGTTWSARITAGSPANGEADAGESIDDHRRRQDAYAQPQRRVTR